ncbi:transportin [Cavenderia fasciculata]|uniref:Transportin n=1 Tax=Cavenderia fasciculata TaxID=261658 RepID=F4PQN2_CACFS|nr:transportin [Cavenderia fasciculata]EGG21199.1 transportin [Cavenderia fasciculata]|eukprot:XP_004359049.1 transportin [Cavenderia fasciculata]
MGDQWAPNEEGLRQLVAILQKTNSGNQEDQNKVRNDLNGFHRIPDYNNYLTFIFAKLPQLEDYVRNCAGLLLKQNIKSYFPAMPRAVQDYIKREVLPVLADPKQNVRHTVANIVTNLIGKSSFAEWQNLLPDLIGGLDSQDPHVVEGALYTLSLLCEDFTDQLDSSEIGRPLNQLIPKLLGFFTSPNPMFRRKAISSLYFFIPRMPGALLINMDKYLQGIFSLTSDESPDVRVKVCRSLVSLVEIRMDFLMPHIHDIIKFMLHATRDQDDEVALEACEFWTSIAQTQNCRPLLREYLPTLVPLLLNCMVYSPEEYEMLDHGEDASVPDRPQDIKPFFANSNVHGGTAGGSGGGDSGGENPEEDYDDDDDDWGEEESWSIRKSSAYALDTLSFIFDNDEFLKVALPTIEQKMSASNEWIVRESSILALGAIAEGCLKGLAPHLHNVVPYLINTLNDEKPLVRSITCWAISRYSSWIVNEGGPQLLQPLIINLLHRILDNNKRVQEAACSAFATIEEDADQSLAPFLPNILTTFVQAFKKYQAKNLLILYDAISTLAKVVGRDLNRPEYVQILIPPLLERFNLLEDNNKALLPLLQCLNPICAAIGMGLKDLLLIFYNRAINIIKKTITDQMLYDQSPETIDAPDREFLVTSLDLISGLAGGIGTSIESLVEPSKLPEILLECMKSREPDVRQSSFALLGDLSRICIVHFQNKITEYIPILMNNLFPDCIPVCNNACWAIGEIAIRLPLIVKPYVPNILQALIPIMKNTKNNKNILENTAITIGRLGLVDAEKCADRIDEYIQCWCMAMRSKMDDSEKDSAFRGMWMIILANPNGALKSLVYICDAIASWGERIEPDLNDAFQKILHIFKENIGPHWPQFYSQFPDQLRVILNQRYHLEDKKN